MARKQFEEAEDLVEDIEETIEVVEAPVRGKKKRVTDDSEEEVMECHNPSYSDLMDELEKHYGLSAESMDPEARRSSVMSTGSLVTDLVLGGGIFPGGWYTIFGPEQSCKSTQTMGILGAAALQNMPLCSISDFEGSTSPDYLGSMWSNRELDMETLFGVKDSHGKWSVEPKVRYYSLAVAEKFFDMLAAVLRRLPNKEFMDGKWYFVYENTKENRKIVGNTYSPKLFSRYNAFYVPAPDGKPQAIFVVDSYPAMLPGKQDVDDPNNAIAVQARMFSDNLKKVKGKLRGKAVTVIGVNQLRAVPMAMYGPTETEPGGTALKFFSDCRLKQTPRAASAAGFVADKGKGGMIFSEESVDGGLDTYRMIYLKAEKNKLSQPGIEGWLRLWVADSDNIARGFDPVYDVQEYLKKTGQVTGNMKKMVIKIGNLEIGPINWLTFKKLVLLTGKDLKEVCQQAGITKPPKLRERCFEQLRSGKALELYSENKKNSDSKEKEEDDE